MAILLAETTFLLLHVLGSPVLPPNNTLSASLSGEARLPLRAFMENDTWMEGSVRICLSARGGF